MARRELPRRAFQYISPEAPNRKASSSVGGPREGMRKQKEDSRLACLANGKSSGATLGEAETSCKHI